MNQIVAGSARPGHAEERSLKLSPVELTVRCFAERHGDQWLAFSVEFGLATQADTLLEAKAKLESMINSYVYDALVGEDREHAYELLTRRAPKSVRFKYFIYSLRTRLSGLTKGSNTAVYTRPMPLEPAACHAY